MGPEAGEDADVDRAPPTLSVRERVAAWWRERSRRWPVGRPQLAVVAIVAIAGCLWAGLSLTQARTVTLSVPTPSPVSSGLATPTSTAAPTPRIQVHVIGAVNQPGVVLLVQGARVQDALTAAGGLRADARPGDLNLAMVVTDGSQIVVGTVAAPGGLVRGAGAEAPTGASASGGSSLINLNTATVDQLDTLPGVGPVTAQAIVAWRSQHGRFTRIEQLGEVDGIGPKTYAQLAPKVTV